MARQAVRFLALLLAGASMPVVVAASNSTGQVSTVDSYTKAQEAAADQAATTAGFTPGPVLFAQDGNFFFNANKGGRSYALTVTPNGQVYASKATR